MISPPNDPERRFLPSTLRRWRRRGAFLVLDVAGLGLAVVTFRVPATLAPWTGGIASLLIGLSLLIYFIAPRLDCPSCKASTEDLAEYCPSCGVGGLVVDRWRGTICGSCRRALGNYKTRTYRIRFCTHCGVLLSRRGV